MGTFYVRFIDHYNAGQFTYTAHGLWELVDFLIYSSHDEYQEIIRVTV